MAKPIIPPHCDREKIAQRFWAKVDKTPGQGPKGECWIWTGYLMPNGYGAIGHTLVHRLCWTLTNDVIPPNMVVRHRCHMRSCVRPDHLRLGTQLENVRDMMADGRYKNAPHAKIAPQSKPSLEERFFAKVQKTDNCWHWIGYRKQKNYGQFHHNGKTELAHRVAWEIAYGPIPEGQWVLHNCDNPSCVRADHLKLGNHQDNMRDLVQRERHYSKLHPELVPRGDRSGMRKHPELICRGERHGKAKLRDRQVVEIKHRLAKGDSAPMLAKEFGVSKHTVYLIAKNSIWKHIPWPSNNQ